MTIPTCHACQSSTLPFDVRLDGARWQHTCGAVVCPACGGAPADPDFLCGLCRSVAHAPTPGTAQINAADVVRLGDVGMTITADRIACRRRRRAGR